MNGFWPTRFAYNFRCVQLESLTGHPDSFAILRPICSSTLWPTCAPCTNPAWHNMCPELRGYSTPTVATSLIRCVSVGNYNIGKGNHRLFSQVHFIRML